MLLSAAQARRRVHPLRFFLEPLFSFLFLFLCLPRPLPPGVPCRPLSLARLLRWRGRPHQRQVPALRERSLLGQLPREGRDGEAVFLPSSSFPFSSSSPSFFFSGHRGRGSSNNSSIRGRDSQKGQDQEPSAEEEAEASARRPEGHARGARRLCRRRERKRAPRPSASRCSHCCCCSSPRLPFQEAPDRGQQRAHCHRVLILGRRGRREREKESSSCCSGAAALSARVEACRALSPLFCSVSREAARWGQARGVASEAAGALAAASAAAAWRGKGEGAPRRRRRCFFRGPRCASAALGAAAAHGPRRGRTGFLCRRRSAECG